MYHNAKTIIFVSPGFLNVYLNTSNIIFASWTANVSYIKHVDVKEVDVICA